MFLLANHLYNFKCQSFQRLLEENEVFSDIRLIISPTSDHLLYNYFVRLFDSNSLATYKHSHPCFCKIQKYYVSRRNI